MTGGFVFDRHCKERSDDAIQSVYLDCFADNPFTRSSRVND